MILIVFASILSFNFAYLQAKKITQDFCQCENITSDSASGYRILNGTLVGRNALPYIGSLAIRDSDETHDITDLFNPTFSDTFYIPLCTLVIINPTFALTAAHCTLMMDNLKNNLEYFIVAAGLDHNLYNIYTNSRQYRLLKNYIRHPDFDKANNLEWNDDIALIEVDLPFKFGYTGIKPACLDKDENFLNKEKKEAVKGNKKFIAAGYGAITDKLESTTELTSNAYLMRFYKHHMKQSNHTHKQGNLRRELFRIFPRYIYDNITQTETHKLLMTRLKLDPLNVCEKFGQNAFCAYSAEGGSCLGDSGGPLLYYGDRKLWVIGINSVNLPDLMPGINGSVSWLCHNSIRTKFTKVHSYIDWIYSHIGDDHC